MPTPQLAKRFRSWFKRDDRVGLAERVGRLEKNVGSLEKNMKKLKDKLKGVSNSAHNGSDDSDDRTDGLQGPAATLDYRRNPSELERRKTQVVPGDLMENIKHNVAQASQTSRSEGGAISDHDEDGSNNDEEGANQHSKGKGPITKDKDQSSQLQPGPSHPPRSSSRNVPANAERPISSLGSLPSRGKRQVHYMGHTQ